MGVKLLCFFIDYIIKRPLTVAWTIPEFNGIVVISFKEISEFAKDYRWMKLIEVWQWIKNSLSSMNRIHGNNDSIDIGEMGSLVNTTSYHKKFCFSKYVIYYMMNHLDDWTVIDVNMRYQSGNIILYASIWYNNDWMRVCWQIKGDIIKFVQMSLNTVFAFSVHRMKQKVIGKYIYKSIT